MNGILEDHFAVRVQALENFQVREFGNVFRNRILRMPFALLVENHHGDAGDGFGHGEDAEDGVLGHRRAAGEVFFAVGL